MKVPAEAGGGQAARCVPAVIGAARAAGEGSGAAVGSTEGRQSRRAAAAAPRRRRQGSPQAGRPHRPLGGGPGHQLTGPAAPLPEPPQIRRFPRQRRGLEDLQPDPAASRRTASLLPLLPSSLPAPGRRDAAPLSRPAAGRRRRPGSRGKRGRELRAGASPPPSTASPKLCLSAAAPAAWAWPRRCGCGLLS